MKISSDGIKFITQWEGCHLTSYQDGGGVWTIGVGHTKMLRLGRKLHANNQSKC